MASARLLGIIGWAGSGKTTLIERLIAALKRRGVKVATIKHAHHPLRGADGLTDGERHTKAGAVTVAVIGEETWELAGVRQETTPPSLMAAAERLAGADLVLVEGFKRAPIPKIEVRRLSTATRKPLAGEDPHVIAIAADHALAAEALPVFALDDIDAIAAFIADHILHLRP